MNSLAWIGIILWGLLVTGFGLANAAPPQAVAGDVAAHDVFFLIAGGLQTSGSGPEFWVVAACAIAIAAGTYAGGWRIIRTMGTGLTEVKPAQGFAAETRTAAAILASSHLGFALSTTQVASGSVIGSGLGRKGAEVRWGTAGRVAGGWLLTLPAAALMGAFAAFIAALGPAGIIVDAVVGTLAILGIFLWSRRNPVTHDNAVSSIENAGEVVRIKKRRSKGGSRSNGKSNGSAAVSVKEGSK